VPFTVVPVASTAALPSVPDYEIFERVGSGGQGVVYRARQLSLPRVVALKFLRDTENVDPERLRDLRKEAEKLAGLQHPNVVTVHAFGLHQGCPYLVLEFVEGGSLARKLAGRPQPPRQAAQLVETLARALAAVHQRGLVHRDLKPGNVLLTADGTPKVTDFGLARRLDGNLTAPSVGRLRGTPAYMAWEQVTNRAAVGPATDVYGLGAILYETLTGRPPFQGEDDVATIRQVERDDPVPPRRLQPTVPRDLEAVCLKCLEKRPRRRYGSAAELADDLRRFLEHRPTRARAPWLWERVLKWAWRRPAQAALAAVSVVALLILLGLVATAVYARQRDQLLDLETTAKKREHGWRQDAETAREAADKARESADRARESAEKAKARESRLRYVNNVLRARERWRDGDAGEARRLLADCPPALRGWEWRYLNARFHPERFTVGVQPDPLQQVAPLDFRGFRSLTFTGDGKLLAAAGWPAGAHVWNAETGREVRTLMLAAGDVLAFSADGKRLATTAVGLPGRPQFGTTAVRVFGLDSDRGLGEETGVFEGASHLVFGFSPLAAAGPDRLAYLSENRILRDAAGNVTGIERKAEKDIELIVDTAGKKEALAVAEGPVHRFVPSGDWGRLAVACGQQHVEIWDLRPPRKRVLGLDVLAGTNNAARRSPFFVRGLALEQKGDYLAVAGGGALVPEVWDVRADPPKPVALRGAGHTAPVTCLAFDGHGRLASGSEDRTVKLWDLRTGQEGRALIGHELPVRELVFNPAGDRLASAGQDGTVRVWDVPAAPAAEPPPGGVVVSPDGRYLVVIQARWPAAGPALVKSTKTGQTVATLSRAGGDFTLLPAFSGDGSLLAVGDNGAPLFNPGGVAQVSPTVTVWDVATGRPVGAEKKTATRLLRIALSPDGKRLAAACTPRELLFGPAPPTAPRTVTVWDVGSGKELPLRGEVKDAAWDVAFSPDGRLLAVGVGGFPSKVRVWDVDTGREEPSFDLTGPPASGGPAALTFSRDGRRLAFGWTDRAVRVWDRRSGEVLVLEGHTQTIAGAAFCPEEAGGGRLATASADGTVRLWDLETGALTLLLPCARDIPPSVAFSPDGRRLYATAGDRPLLTWEAPP
jgi:WD40 repeat protein